jgi:hypothetical protein
LLIDALNSVCSFSSGHACAERAREMPPRIGIAMDLNRNQFFFLGLVVLLVGLQVRYVSAYVLSPETTKFLAERTGQASADSPASSLIGSAAAPRKVVQPPEWLSWCLISVGAVLCLHSLAMPKPG